MRNPVQIDLVGDRGVAFQDTITRVGIDLTGAAFSAQVRLMPDATGSALITPTVTLLYGGSATITAHLAAGRITTDIYGLVNPATGVKYVAGDVIPVSVIQIAINNTQMIAPYVPQPGTSGTTERGDDAVLAWDMLIQPSGGLNDKWFYGEFRVRGTVTQ